MNTGKHHIRGGLIATPSDERDFRYSAIFGSISREELPDEDFVVAEPLEIKNQGDTDMCTAFGVSAVSEDQEEVILSPYYIWSKIKQIRGESKQFGSDLRTPCKAAVQYGFVERDILQNYYKQDSPQPNNAWRDYFAKWTNVPVDFDWSAKKHKKQSYMLVEGPHDTFDNFRSVLWKNRDKKKSIFTGCVWRESWTYIPKGIIPKKSPGNTFTFGHAFKIYGQKRIDGELYLIAQLSNSDEIGDKGRFYFSREVVNREFIYKAFVFEDMPPEELKFMSQHNLPIKVRWIVKVVLFLKSLFGIK